MSERYPLEAVRMLRAREQEDAERALAGAIAAHDEAQVALGRAEAARSAHAEESARIAREERARDAGGRSALELMRVEAWLARRRDEARALTQKVDELRQRARAASVAVDTARTALAQARAEREALDRHHGAWLDARRRAADEREQDEADERASRRR